MDMFFYCVILYEGPPPDLSGFSYDHSGYQYAIGVSRIIWFRGTAFFHSFIYNFSFVRGCLGVCGILPMFHTEHVVCGDVTCNAFSVSLGNRMDSGCQRQ